MPKYSMIGNVPSVAATLAQKYDQNVAPTSIDAAKAKTARDAEAIFYAAPVKDLVEGSVYNRDGSAPTVDAKVGRILDIRV